LRGVRDGRDNHLSRVQRHGLSCVVGGDAVLNEGVELGVCQRFLAGGALASFDAVGEGEIRNEVEGDAPSAVAAGVLHVGGEDGVGAELLVDGVHGFGEIAAFGFFGEERHGGALRGDEVAQRDADEEGGVVGNLFPEAGQSIEDGGRVGHAFSERGDAVPTGAVPTSLAYAFVRETQREGEGAGGVVFVAEARGGFEQETEGDGAGTFARADVGS